MCSSLLRWPGLVVLFVLVLGGGFGSTELSAQEADDPPAPVRASEADPAQDEGSDAEDVPTDREEAAAEGSSAPQDAWDRLIYIPFRNLKTVFDQQQGTVLLPYFEYLRMWEQGGAESKPRTESAPIEAVISEAHYTARVDQNLARISAELSIRVLGKPWVELPVQFGEAAVGKIESDNGKVLLRGTGQGAYVLLLPQAGEQVIRLELVQKIDTSPEGRSFEFRCPPAGIATFEVVLPETDQTIEMTPQLVSLPAEADEDATRTKVNLGSTDRLSLRWYPRTGTKPDMELLAGVSNLLQVSVDEGLIHTSAQLTYEILRGELSEVRIAVPLEHRILDVSIPGATLKGWNSIEEEDRQVLRLELLRPITGKFQVEVHTERPLPENPFQPAGRDEQDRVQGIHALDAVRENGRLILTPGSDLALNVERVQGLTRVDEREIPDGLRRLNSLYYKFYNPSFLLDVSALPIEPRVVVDHSSLLTFGTDELRLKADLRYEIDRAGLFELSLRLPDGLTIDSVAADGMQEYRVDAATQTLIVSLREKRLGQIGMTVRGRMPVDTELDDTQHVLPILEPLNVSREIGTIHLSAPEALDIVTDESSLIGVRPEPAGSIESIGGAKLVSSWSYQLRPIAIEVTTSRKPTRVTADIGTTINVQPELVELTSLLTYSIEHAGLDTFRFAVPAEVGNRVQIRAVSDDSGASIRQRSSSEPDEEGWVAWTVVLQQPVLGRQQFEISYDLKPQAAAEETGEAPRKSTILVEPLRVLPPDAEAEELEEGEEPIPGLVRLSRITGEVAVQRDRALSVSADVEGTDVEFIDVRELTLLPQSGSLAYRYFQQPVQISLTAQRHDIQDVLQTVVSRGLIEIVAGHDSFLTYRCRYRINSSERQRLAIDLPRNVEPLGVLLDEKPVNLEKSDDPQADDDRQAYFVNVARTNRSDEPFILTLQFRVPLGSRLFTSQGGGRLQFVLPRIGGARADGVAVQQVRTVIWIPEHYTLVGTPDRFTREDRSRWGGLWSGRIAGQTATNDLDRWIGNSSGGLIDFPTAGRAYRYHSLGDVPVVRINWFPITLHTWVISGGLLLIGWVLRNISWESKLSLVLIVTFAAVLWSLNDPDWVLHVLASARFGIAAVLVFWLLHGLMGTSSASTPADDAARKRLQDEASFMTPQSGGATAAVIPPPGVFEWTMAEYQSSKQSGESSKSEP